MKNEKAAGVLFGLEVSPFFEPVDRVFRLFWVWVPEFGYPRFLPPVDVGEEEDPVPAIIEKPVEETLPKSAVVAV